MTPSATNRLARTAFAAGMLALGTLSGCASQEAYDLRPMARCPVCDANADLACVDVRVDDHTPHAEYRGKTYYFCSEECRAEFLKHPAKYSGE